MAIMIREATVDDAEAVALAHMRAWQEAYRGIVPQDFLDAIDLAERTERWRGNLEAKSLPNGLRAPTDYVAEVDGQVVGFANVGLWRQEPDDASLAELWAMYVHPDQWGTGAGYALMQTTMAHFRDVSASTAYLWVLEDNGLARRFYERQGWQADDATMEDAIGGITITERRYSIQLTQANRPKNEV